MKLETFWEILQQEQYQALTVAEFVEVVKDSKVMEDEPFPSFSEESIRLHEEKMELKEKRERFADYSDQEAK